MSSAFVKEGEAKHLKDVAPNLGALLFFLRVENNGMSDWLSYALDDENYWYITECDS